MNKKQYIKPTMEVVEMEVATPMLAESNVTVLPGEEGEEQLSNRHRGSWGNLWDNK